VRRKPVALRVALIQYSVLIPYRLAACVCLSRRSFGFGQAGSCTIKTDLRSFDPLSCFDAVHDSGSLRSAGPGWGQRGVIENDRFGRLITKCLGCRESGCLCDENFALCFHWLSCLQCLIVFVWMRRWLRQWL
jgi:hypothetical protein